jgi:tyrosyl-tRNA synthetase
VTTIVHGRTAMQRAQEISGVLFGGAPVATIINPTDCGVIVHRVTPHEMALVDILLTAQLASSKREAREFITSGAVSLGGVKITDVAYVIAQNDFEENDLQVIRRGKQKAALLSRV